MPSATTVWSSQIGDTSNVSASAITNSVTTGITASTTQSLAGSVPLTSQINVITVCATLGNAVSLPSAALGIVGDSVVVINKGAAAAGVYPQTADAIDALSAGTSIGVGIGKRAIFYCTGLNAWASIGGAVSS